jgi:hypothetical protein
MIAHAKMTMHYAQNKTHRQQENGSKAPSGKAEKWLVATENSQENWDKPISGEQAIEWQSEKTCAWD